MSDLLDWAKREVEIAGGGEYVIKRVFSKE